MAHRLPAATKLADGLALLFVAVVFVVHIATGFLEIQSFAYGKSDTALYEQGLWLASQFRMPVSLAYPGVVKNIFLGQHVMLPGFLYALRSATLPTIRVIESDYNELTTHLMAQKSGKNAVKKAYRPTTTILARVATGTTSRSGCQSGARSRIDFDSRH